MTTSEQRRAATGPVRVTVNKGRYATVRAIEQSGIKPPARARLIAETDWAYVYEVWATDD